MRETPRYNPLQKLNITGNMLGKQPQTTVNYDRSKDFRWLQFDGVDDYVDMGNYAITTTLNQPFSASAWIKTSSADGLHHVIVGKVLSSGNYTGWDMRVDNLGKFAVPLVSTIAKQYSKYFNKIINDNTWHHVGFTYDGIGFAGLKGYVDGVEITALTTSVNNAATTDSISNVVSLKIGSRDIQYFNGTIDEVSVWNRVLSAAEILTLYERRFPDVSKTGLVLFHDYKTGTAKDLSGNGNNGTVIGAQFQ